MVKSEVKAAKALASAPSSSGGKGKSKKAVDSDSESSASESDSSSSYQTARTSKSLNTSSSSDASTINGGFEGDDKSTDEEEEDGDDDDEEEDEDEDENDDFDGEEDGGGKARSPLNDEERGGGGQEEDEPKKKKEKKHKKEKKKKSSSDFSDSAISFASLLDARGVIYLSRLPPKLSVSKLKQLLSQHGAITRLYLQREDKSVGKRRARLAGGSKRGKRFTEGWVEFSKKKVAKRVAGGLHMTNMEGEKRGQHVDDLWCMKYLKGFKWAHLTEKVAYERRVREQKLAVEMANSKRENKEFERLVEEGEKFDKMAERKAKKRERGAGDGDERSEKRGGSEKPEFKRTFKQTKPIENKW